ncbi:MAG: primosomal protein N' [Alphaproteobacteria bacterium]|nr:primosomal protein N' [Alphaproteobacteria bacterium]
MKPSEAPLGAQIEVLLPTAAPHGFDYLAGSHGLQAGDIVTVPFGRGESLGVVWGKGTANLPPAKMKPVAAKHSEYPRLSDALRAFVDWAAWYNCAPKGAMLKMVLPIAEVVREMKSRVKIDTAIDPQKFNLAPLSDTQKNGADTLEEKLGKGFSVTLLDGVTGSGKTEVYYDTIAKILASDAEAQVLVMLPEIALSVQSLSRFEQRFGTAPLVWNSEITPAKKRATWQAISQGSARVIVGARSALFLPYKKLALIVVDEEHDQSYKQEEGVIYHARDMAVARARFEKLPVLLVSATPSLESYYNVKQGKYAEVSLPARHGAAEMPDIHMLDMKKVPVARGGFISEPLREKIAAAVAAGHQAMLFLNRRGYAPLMLCRACGHRFQCPDCSSWLVLHKGKPRLECHHCGYNLPVPKTCPSCQAEDNFAPCGPGVERISEEVVAFMPEARVAVMASDSSENFKGVEETIVAMAERKIDVLIGTQMIAKGHHFAGLAVVGVVDADLGLAGGDLRAAERTYQLLHQLSGRAGRESVAGSVYLQSYFPEHPVMQALISGDRDKFLAAELTARKNGNMPPFARLAAVIVDGAKENEVLQTAKQLAASAGHHSNKALHILGPAPAPLFMLRGKFRYRLLVQADKNINLPEFMQSWLGSVQHPSSVRVRADIDPQSFL